MILHCIKISKFYCVEADEKNTCTIKQIAEADKNIRVQEIHTRRGTKKIYECESIVTVYHFFLQLKAKGIEIWIDGKNAEQ